MSGSGLNPSLPSRPITTASVPVSNKASSTTNIITSSVPNLSLPARPTFALPPRPSVILPPPSKLPSTNPRSLREDSPDRSARSIPYLELRPPPAPLPSLPRRRRDTFSRSPSPVVFERRDKWDTNDFYRPGSPGSGEGRKWEGIDRWVASPSPPAQRRERGRGRALASRSPVKRGRTRSVDSYSRSTVRRGYSRSPVRRVRWRSPVGRGYSRSPVRRRRSLSRDSVRSVVIDKRSRQRDQRVKQEKFEETWKDYKGKEKSLGDRLGAIVDDKAVLGDQSSAFQQARKRPASPTVQTPQPPVKLNKPIPSGPRVVVPGAPTGPRSSGPRIPTGPKSLFASPSTSTSRPIPTGPKSTSRPQIAAYSTETLFKTRSGSTSPRIDNIETRFIPDFDSIDMPPFARAGRGSSKSGGSTPRPTRGGTPGGSGRNLKPLEGPLMDKEEIIRQYRHVQLKGQWVDNPKGPLTNHFGANEQRYTVVEGTVDGQRVFRASLVATEDGSLVGVGDGPTKKEAEKVAALSALVQLVETNQLVQGNSGLSGGKGQNTSGSGSSGNSGEKAIISDKSSITYDRARQFMEYYCQRYKFGKPDIEFSSTSKGKKGRGKPSTAWDAVMTVGGRRIGMGSAATKKAAQIKCYLDVTQYLESCDRGLWTDFLEHSKKDSSADLGMAPHLVFQMSDGLVEDVYGLCGDIKASTLYRNAPTSGVSVVDPAGMPAWSGSRGGRLSEEAMKAKSQALMDKLANYQVDPNLVKMRAQRDSLPVMTKATDILAKIEVNDVTIVMAATGSGKTTQIPQMLLDDWINKGEGAKCNVMCTQPRRLAAMSVAERIADERGDRLGGEVGYQVRFDVKLPQPNGSITFCTTGIFLKRMQSSLGEGAHEDSVRGMDDVTHIVVDEVHERDIDTDLLLVVLKRLLMDRKARGIPLKVILMSATIDPTLFQNYFKDEKGRPAPIAEVPGRTFPVEKHYLNGIVPALQKNLSPAQGGWVFQEKKVAEYLNRELAPDPGLFGHNTGMELEIPYPLVALIIAHVLKQSDDGHVLVFLPGWDEIKKVADILLDQSNRFPLLGLRLSDTSQYSVHYLHSTIPAAEQRQVFKPPPKGVRRIILATNIAETSITIPDVVYVVDTGRVKEKRYDPDRHMSSLVTAWVGSSNLNQRAGRAGRHREGEYYGLVSENRMRSLSAHQLVEMKRSDLSNVVMHVKALNLGEVETVLAATIEPPEHSRIVSAMQSLRELGAMDAEKNLTALGRVLLQLPVEAAIGKICLYGSFFRCLDSALTLAAVLTNRDPFLAPPALKQQSDAIKDSWSPLAFRSDPLAIVAAYNEWAEYDNRGDYSAGSRFCHENFLSKPTLLQIKQVKGALLQSLDQAGVIAVSAGGSVGRLGGRMRTVPRQLNEHGGSLPLLAALISMASAPNFALRTSEKSLRTAQDKIVFIHPSSVNARKRETGGPKGSSSSFNPAEKRLYAFSEKARNVPASGKMENALTQLRNVTRLDPMTYMLFGAYNLLVTQRGLECDGWLPITGNLHALDDIQRLKSLLDGCMLRVFEGVGKSLVRGRDERWKGNRDSVKVQEGSSKIVEPDTNDDGEGEDENESDDDDEQAEAEVEKKKRVVQPLSVEEIKELELLTTDVVRILDAYATEREGSGSSKSSRPVSPQGAGEFGGGGAAVYKPPMMGATPRRW